MSSFQNTPFGNSGRHLAVIEGTVINPRRRGSTEVLESGRTPNRKGKWEPGPGISRAEAQAIIEQAETTKHRLLIRTLFATGARVSEVLQLRPSGIRKDSLILPLGKNRSRSWNEVLIDPKQADVIAELLLWVREQSIRDEQPVFFGRKRDVPMTRQAAGLVFRECSARAGVSVVEDGQTIAAHPHTARHSLTRWQLAEGLPLPHIMKLRGWSSIASGMPYLNPTTDQVREALGKVSA